MSQTPPMQVELKPEDRKLLQSAIELLSKPQPTSNAPFSLEKDEAEGHKTIEEIENCPTCRKTFKIDEYNEKKKAQFLKEWAEKLKGHKIVQCKGCGLGVPKEIEKCPNCGGTAAE